MATNTTNIPLSIDDLKKLKIPALKEKLQGLGLEVKGSKNELVARLASNTSSSSALNVRSQSSTCTCPICCDTIVDTQSDDGRDGDDSIFCEGLCNSWLHRRCAGLSVQAFNAINADPNKDRKPFRCPHCCLALICFRRSLT